MPTINEGLQLDVPTDGTWGTALNLQDYIEPLKTWLYTPSSDETPTGRVVVEIQTSVDGERWADLFSLSTEVVTRPPERLKYVRGRVVAGVLAGRVYVVAATRSAVESYVVLPPP